MTKSYRFGERGSPLSAELCALMQEAETATIGHFEVLGFLGAGIVPLSPLAKVAGAALTVAASGRDGTIIYRAVDLVSPGDVLVIARVDRDDVACVGGGVVAAAKARGAAAIIIDGPCTDANEIAASDFPVWCRGVSARTTSRRLAIGGAINLPVACGEAAVLPGYAVLADENGVYVADPQTMKAAAGEAIRRQEQSRRLRPLLAAGRSIFELDGMV